MRNLVLVSFVAALSVGAQAQSLDPKKRFCFEAGLYLPSASFPDGISTDAGLTLGLGGDFVVKQNYAVGLDLRDSAFNISDSSDSATISVGSLLLTGRYRLTGSKAYVGAGLGYGQASVDIDGYKIKGNTEFAYSAELGYDFTNAFYGMARYQDGSYVGLRGVTIGVGVRF